MITTTDKTVSVIKDLMIINNDRHEGYKTASNETKESDLKSMFDRFSNQSSQFNAELRRFIPTEDSPEGETLTSGKIYRAWMDIRAALSTNDRKTILSSCEYGEDVALSAYKSALDEGQVSEEIRIAIRKQKDDIQEAHNTVKAMRDRA
ncbi:MAG: PA2169 family four-helix-bundle protein [Bacteroidota bacterium]